LSITQHSAFIEITCQPIKCNKNTIQPQKAAPTVFSVNQKK